MSVTPMSMSVFQDIHFDLILATGLIILTVFVLAAMNKRKRPSKRLFTWLHGYGTDAVFGDIKGIPIKEFAGLLGLLVAIASWYIAWYIKTEYNHIRALGWTSSLVLGIAFLISARWSPVLSALGLTYAQGIHLHRWTSRIAVTFVISHFALAYASYGRRVVTAEKWSRFVTFIFICIPMVLAPFRRYFYDAFHYEHFLTPIAAVAMSFLHAKYKILWFLLPGLAFWLISRLYYGIRAYRSANSLVLHDIVHAGGYTKIRLFQEGLQQLYPASYIYLNVPRISSFQWKPFTLVPVPHDPERIRDEKNRRRSSASSGYELVEVFVKMSMSRGRGQHKPKIESDFAVFTEKLAHIACEVNQQRVREQQRNKRPSATAVDGDGDGEEEDVPLFEHENALSISKLKMHIEGPFGSSKDHVPLLHYTTPHDHVCFVAGGSGISVVLSHVLYLIRNGGCTGEGDMKMNIPDIECVNESESTGEGEGEGSIQDYPDESYSSSINVGVDEIEEKDKEKEKGKGKGKNKSTSMSTTYSSIVPDEVNPLYGNGLDMGVSNDDDDDQLLVCAWNLTWIMKSSSEIILFIPHLREISEYGDVRIIVSHEGKGESVDVDVVDVNSGEGEGVIDIELELKQMGIQIEYLGGRNPTAAEIIGGIESKSEPRTQGQYKCSTIVVSGPNSLSNVVLKTGTEMGIPVEKLTFHS